MIWTLVIIATSVAGLVVPFMALWPKDSAFAEQQLNRSREDILNFISGHNRA
jgi:hypothetical protein